jgi:NitT/TauT family transport system permease protein
MAREADTPSDFVSQVPTLEEDMLRVRKEHRRESRFLAVVYPLTAVVGGILVWYALIYIAQMPDYILPRPDQMIRELYLSAPLFFKHGWVTIYEAVGGFLLGVALGIPIAVGIVWSDGFGRALMPILVFTQTMPKVAIAPLFILWFGFGILPKIVVAFLICFFPIVISMATGLQSVEREMLELVRSMSATKYQVFLKARIPTSVPFLFSGLKVAITLSVIGAIVGEFVGANQGLGYLVLVANGQVDTPLLFAILVILACIGFGLYAVVSYVERIFIPWHVAETQEGMREFSY